MRNSIEESWRGILLRINFKSLAHPLVNRQAVAVFFFSCLSSASGAEYLVNVTSFGAVADAKMVNGAWSGTDNAAAFNKCAAYVRKNGMTMYVPKGNYGVASTVWLTNPKLDGLRQAALTVVGSNRGAFANQEYSANICVLKDFKSGKMVQVKKKDGKETEEPYLPPVLGISNGRQVHIEGIGILGGNTDDLMCGVAIGDISQMTSVRFCSISNIYAGIVFPGIRPEPNESVIEGNNDLLVVEQSYLRNTYNIVCAGTQPFACEYRNNRMQALKSIFTGKLITNEYGYTRGSHKFSSNLFGTIEHSPEDYFVYFDLSYNEVIIDSCHFEPGWMRKNAEVILRAHPEAHPNGGAGKRIERISFTNNLVNFSSLIENTGKYTPIFDTMVGNRMILQGNEIRVGGPIRIKADGVILIGNMFECTGPHQKKVEKDRQFLLGTPGDIERGLYDINHFIRRDSEIKVIIPDGNELKQGEHFKLHFDKNAFEILEPGKRVIDKAKTNLLLLSYTANDAAGIKFQAYGAHKLNPPHGWKTSNTVLLGNKIVYKTDSGFVLQRELVPADLN